MTRYNFKINPRDFIQIMPLDLKDCTTVFDNESARTYNSQAQIAQDKPKINDNSKYIVMNHTTTNDLAFQYNMGFGNLVINDFRVKEFRIERRPYPERNRLQKNKIDFTSLSRLNHSVQHRRSGDLNIDPDSQKRSSQRSRDNFPIDPMTPSPLKTRINLSYSRTKQHDDLAGDMEDEDDEIRNFHEKMSEGHGLDNSPELHLRQEISEKQFDFG